MSCLFELPKEIIIHILSYVVYNVYQTSYLMTLRVRVQKITTSIQRIDDMLDANIPFSRLNKYPMTKCIHILRLVHPKINEIIHSVCSWNTRGWTFKEPFVFLLKKNLNK